jgi:hypothetical protein
MRDAIPIVQASIVIRYLITISPSDPFQFARTVTFCKLHVSPGSCHILMVIPFAFSSGAGSFMYGAEEVCVCILITSAACAKNRLSYVAEFECETCSTMGEKRLDVESVQGNSKNRSEMRDHNAKSKTRTRTSCWMAQVQLVQNQRAIEDAVKCMRLSDGFPLRACVCT